MFMNSFSYPVPCFLSQLFSACALPRLILFELSHSLFHNVLVWSELPLLVVFVEMLNISNTVLFEPFLYKFPFQS
jgi:hypothetical protein